MKNNLLVVMSGGTTSVINATLCGIVEEAKRSEKIDRIIAGFPGILGFNNDKMVDLTDLSEAQLSQLYYIPTSCFIGTTRIEKDYFEGVEKLTEQLEKYNVTYFINIGGNGTIKQSARISEVAPWLRIAAAPKTVDNDLGDKEFEKVYYTPGYPSCINYWKHKISIMNLENIGAHSHDKVLIAQTFGRETGFLVGAGKLINKEGNLPILLLLPEDQQEERSVVDKIENTLRRYDRAVVIMSEGYKIGKIGEVRDKSGQIMYGSSMSTNAQNLVNLCCTHGIQARSLVPAIDQRSDGIFCTRGDLKASYELGIFTVYNLVNGENKFLSSINCNNEFIGIPFAETEDYSRKMKPEWIEYGGFDVTSLYVDYMEALIDDPLYDFSIFESNL